MASHTRQAAAASRLLGFLSQSAVPTAVRQTHREPMLRCSGDCIPARVPVHASSPMLRFIAAVWVKRRTGRQCGTGLPCMNTSVNSCPGNGSSARHHLPNPVRGPHGRQSHSVSTASPPCFHWSSSALHPCLPRIAPSATRRSPNQDSTASWCAGDMRRWARLPLNLLILLDIIRTFPGEVRQGQCPLGATWGQPILAGR